MDPQNWKKLTNNIPTSPRSYIKSKNHRKMQQDLHHHILQIQEHFQNKYSRKQIYIQPNQIHSGNGNKLIILTTKPPTPDHIGDVVKSTLRYNCLDSIFSNDEKMEKSTTFSAPFIRYSLPQDTKILRPRIYSRVKKTGIDNKYDLYSRTCAYGSSILEGLNFTVSYAPVSGIRSLCIIIIITYVDI